MRVLIVSAVSQLVTQEFNDISQRLELEQGLRQHAEVFAHQVLSVYMYMCVFMHVSQLRTDFIVHVGAEV